MPFIENPQIVGQSDSAFYQEHFDDFEMAYSLHEATIAGLKAISQNQKNTRETAKEQITFRSNRLPIFRSFQESKQVNIPVTLPTRLSAEQSLNSLYNAGETVLGLEEPLFCRYLLDSFENPDIVPPTQIQHLLTTPVPAFAPTLNPSLPSTKYNITVDMDRDACTYWLKASLASHPDQTFYMLKANRSAKKPLDNVSFFRAAELARPCIDINIAPIESTGDRYPSSVKGRAVEYILSNSIRPVLEIPDRLENQLWGLQRLSYAGRQFAWVTDGTKALQLPMLYETESAWSSSGTVTGKDHSIVGPKLCWGSYKGAVDTTATVEIAGGIDQVFSELLLASQMAKLSIFLLGQ